MINHGIKNFVHLLDDKLCEGISMNIVMSKSIYFTPREHKTFLELIKFYNFQVRFMISYDRGLRQCQERRSKH